jgi:DNA replication protein DnaC
MLTNPISSLADPTCQICHGEGQIWLDTESIVPTTGMTCACVRDAIVRSERERRLTDAAIPERYKAATVDEFHLRPGHVAVIDRVRRTKRTTPAADLDAENAERVRQLAESPLTNETIVFIGPHGAGKTYLACALLRAQILNHNKTGLYITALDFAQTLLPDGAEPAVQRALRETTRSVDIILLDDLGVEKPSLFFFRELWGLVHARTANGRATIITSNERLRDLLLVDLDQHRATPDQIELAAIGRRIYSRLYEFGITPIEWPLDTADFRRTARSGKRPTTYGEARRRRVEERQAIVAESIIETDEAF